MRVRMIDNVTGKVVRVAKQFSKAVVNAPEEAAPGLRGPSWSSTRSYRQSHTTRHQ